MQSFDVDADQEILVAIEPSQNRVLECRSSEFIAINSVLYLCFCQKPVPIPTINLFRELLNKLPWEVSWELPWPQSGELAGKLLFDAGVRVQSLLRKCHFLPLENMPGSSL